MRTLLTPNEVAVLANTPKSVVEKVVEQKILASPQTARSRRRSLPLYTVAVAAAAAKSLGRRLTVGDKKLVARELAGLSPAALKTAECKIASNNDPTRFVVQGIGVVDKSSI